MNEVFSISLPSKFESISPCIQNAVEQLDKLSILNDQEKFDIKLALEEAITNSIKHGNKQQPDLYVKVDMHLDDGQLIMTVKDQGEGFDYLHVPNPREKDRLLNTSGRGVFLIRKIMDSVEYSDAGREVKMKKFLSHGKG